uniref:Uncharacterized protein n=1 Tax=Pithovirus LCDPAC02 TaxID=2506601 RepID=A0A481YRR9_9VIRU|nr:MAG: hypothetical protein LCDPAC02_03630 [Pithovirus LCDPAC02]
MLEIKIPENLYPNEKQINVGLEYDKYGRIMKNPPSLEAYYYSMKRERGSGKSGKKFRSKRRNIYNGKEYTKNKNSNCKYVVNTNQIYEIFGYDIDCEDNKGIIKCNEDTVKEYLLYIYEQYYGVLIYEYLKEFDIIKYDNEQKILTHNKNGKIIMSKIKYKSLFGNMGNDNIDYVDIIFN